MRRGRPSDHRIRKDQEEGREADRLLQPEPHTFADHRGGADHGGQMTKTPLPPAVGEKIDGVTVSTNAAGPTITNGVLTAERAGCACHMFPVARPSPAPLTDSR